jgi:hypothetical protein
MHSFIGQPPRLTLVASGLIAIFFILSLSESSIKSPMSDEPPHIASGLSYVATGVFRGNPQHPPLLKELSGLSLLLGGIRWPRNAATAAFLRGDTPPGQQPEWQIGNDLIIANGPDHVMFWARLPLILVSCLLGVMLYLWGRQLFGGVAAVGAVLLFASDPTILANSFSVTMDVGLAAGSILFLLALWNYMESPGVKRLVLCGAALGVLLAVKFSAVLLLPVAALLLWGSQLWPVKERDEAATAGAAPSPKMSRRIARNERCPCGSGKKYKACHGVRASAETARSSRPDLGRRLALSSGAWLAMCVIAMVVVQGLYFFPRDPLVYLRGLKMVNADHISNYLAYMAGDLQKRFLSYFAVAYLLKEPIATIILAGIGLVTLVRSRSIPVAAKLFLLLPPAAMFAGPTLMADDIGIRYIMPVLPFGFLLGGLGLATLLRMPAKWAKWTAVGLSLWVVAATCGIYPDHLSYFNESACLLRDPGRLGLDGGSQCGTAWLDDSNLDWGQGLKQLKVWLDKHAPGRTIRLSTIYGFPPEAYGIRSQPADHGEIMYGPTPGLYVVSAHVVTHVSAMGEKYGTGAGQWLRRTPPAAIVGHSLYVYDIPQRSAATPVHAQSHAP